MSIIFITGFTLLWAIVFLVIMKSVYDKLGWVCTLILFMIALLSDYPKVMVALHGLLFVLGCTFVVLAVWSEINDFTLISLHDRRFSFLTRSARLNERQKIFRLNFYFIFGGLLVIVGGLLGMLRPGTFIGFPFER